jgi:curved DNA-binding protein CbpA
VPSAVLHPAPVAAPTAAATPQSELEKTILQRAATVDGDDLFAVLGIERTANADQVKTAYLEGARRFHPDRLASQNLTHLRADVEKIFRRLSEAQSTLLDDEKRTQYRKTLENPPANKEDVAAHQQALSILQAEMAFRRGQYALKKNDLQAALRDFEAALAAAPNEGEHVIFTAWTRHCLQQLSIADAKAEIQRGLKLSPKAGSGHYLLGMLQKEESAFDAALASFRKAVSLDARQFEAEQEIRVLEVRLARQNEKRGLFDRFRKPGK